MSARWKCIKPGIDHLSLDSLTQADCFVAPTIIADHDAFLAMGARTL